MTPNQLKRQRLSHLKSVSRGYLDSITAHDVAEAARRIEAARKQGYNAMNGAAYNSGGLSNYSPFPPGHIV